MTFEQYLDLVIEELHRYFNILNVDITRFEVTLRFNNKFCWQITKLALIKYYETSDKDYKLHAFILKGAIEQDYLSQIRK